MKRYQFGSLFFLSDEAISIVESGLVLCNNLTITRVFALNQWIEKEQQNDY